MVISQGDNYWPDLEEPKGSEHGYGLRVDFESQAGICAWEQIAEKGSAEPAEGERGQHLSGDDGG